MYVIDFFKLSRASQKFATVEKFLKVLQPKMALLFEFPVWVKVKKIPKS